MSLEKAYDVEIGDKDYVLEMSNLALFEFERLTGKGYMEWIQTYILDSEGDIKWQPPYGDFLKLVICQLKKHQPRTKFTVATLSNHIGPKDVISTLGVSVMNCLTACLVDDEDVDSQDDDSPEAGADDPLDESPKTGTT